MTPEPGVYCVEPGCNRSATTERPHSVTRDGELVVELVCRRHANENSWWRQHLRHMAWHRRLTGGRK